jgi:hypothetical protein
LPLLLSELGDLEEMERTYQAERAQLAEAERRAEVCAIFLREKAVRAKFFRRNLARMQLLLAEEVGHAQRCFSFRDGRRNEGTSEEEEAPRITTPRLAAHGSGEVATAPLLKPHSPDTGRRSSNKLLYSRVGSLKNLKF